MEQPSFVVGVIISAATGADPRLVFDGGCGE